MRSCLAFATAVALLCCSEPTSRPSTTATPPTQSEMQTLELAGICIQGGYAAFLTEAQRLAAATEQLAANPSDEALWTEAKAAWVAAMERWQEQEAMHIGPASSVTLPGGQGLRDEVYSWPLVSRCVVEQTLVNQNYQQPDFPVLSLVNARGLAALEYLLFYEGTDNGCGPTASINSSGSWAALSPEELRNRKAAYAKAVAADILHRAQELVDLWATDKGNFPRTLTTAGPGNGTFPSAQVALNTLAGVLVLHVDKEVKDQKLGRPLGLKECTTGTCPETLESRYAKRSRQHLIANLRGAKKILRGCNEDGVGGLDELIRTREAPDLAKQLVAANEAAIQALEAISPDDLEAALAQNPDAVKSAYTAVKTFSDLLKNELVLVLGLQLPSLVSGDND
ncbi:MAG: imelysin family protein [Myxococcales bacterium]|nr:imelysin family protein [Polyangiaceae bacterium]MDW8249530.1 imelysin family protein [Myxococcales bacterium]